MDCSSHAPVVGMKVPCAVGPETLRAGRRALLHRHQRAGGYVVTRRHREVSRKGRRVTEQDRARRGDPPEHADGTVLDEVETRLGFRAFFAKHAWLDLTYRIVVGVVGAAVVVLGFVLIPLPGPGW